MSPLPVWLLYLQALALVAIPTVGAWLAWQQVGIARAKLQHDLYDRRYKVFNAVRDLISEVFEEGGASTKSLRAYFLATADAPFLLDDELSRYIDEIRKRVFHLRDIERKQINPPPGSDIDAMIRESDEVFDWLDKQREVLTEKFRPVLQLPQVRTFPWQRP